MTRTKTQLTMRKGRISISLDEWLHRAGHDVPAGRYVEEYGAQLRGEGWEFLPAVKRAT